MEENKRYTPGKYILMTYVLCFVFRIMEYMWWRTDQSIFGEAFIHKLIGILILGIAIKYFSLSWKEIGFTSKSVIRNLLYGLSLGLAVFFIAYGAEFLIQRAMGDMPMLQIYVSSYATTGNVGNNTGLMFFVFCILGNVINVVMEEGVFRGLFVKLYEKKYTFLKAVILSATLFGLWHVMAPIRSLIEGEISPMGAMMSMLMLVITSGLMGIKWSLLAKMTGSLWMPMADHFVNNTIVNMLHIVTASGSDEWMFVRISIAQSLSFLIVLGVYLRKYSKSDKRNVKVEG